MNTRFYIVIGLMLLALSFLLRVLWKWGYRRGVIDEYERPKLAEYTEEQKREFWDGLKRDGLDEKIIACSVPRPGEPE